MEISHFFDYRLFVFFCVILIKDIGQETSIQIYRRLATLLFVDWLPQVNGFAASFFVYTDLSAVGHSVIRGLVTSGQWFRRKFLCL